MSSFAIGHIDAFEDKLLKLPFDSLRQGGPWSAYVEDHSLTPEERNSLRILRDNQMTITIEKGPFDSFLDFSEEYQDGYTAQWFPVDGDMITCGNRKDLTRKQRVHDYVSLGKDFKNKGIAGICEVIVFACSVCGRDWRE